MPFTSFLAFYFLAPTFLVFIEALALERITILKLSSVDKLFDFYLFDFESTSKLSSDFNSIKDKRVILEKVNYFKIDFFKTIFKEINFKSEIVIFFALKVLSKYFIITIRLLVINIVNERNFKYSSSDSFAISILIDIVFKGK